MSGNLLAPDADEIEVSIFGKGFGEAIVVHMGGGHWVAVDSIGLDKRSASRLYLEEIGVNLATHLNVIVATHWHDDHVKGLSDLFAHAPRAELVMAPAMMETDFFKFIAAFVGQKGRRTSSGVDEIAAVMKIAGERKEAGARWPIVLPGAGQPIWRRHAGLLPHGLPVTLETLSPSSFEQTMFLARIAGLRPSPHVLQQAPSSGKNDLSIALHLTVGNDAVLLGADLENTSKPDTGWDAVLGSSIIPPSKASIVKVPHHGGRSGHHAGMWSTLAAANPVASVTPWSRGGRTLPTKGDVARLLALASRTFVTAPSATLVGPQQPTIVAKAFRKNNLALRRQNSKVGHIRHRAKIVGGALEWKTDLFGAACPIHEMAA